MTNNKKNFFKTFLTTASAFAVIIGASGDAMGALVTDNNGGDVVITNAGGVNTDQNFNDGDNFYFANANHKLTTGDNVTIGSIDLNNNAPGLFTVAHNTTLGPVVDVAGNGANKINVVVNDGLALTLADNAGKDATDTAINAKTFTGLGDIILGSGGGGELIFNTKATITGTIDGDGAGVPMVNINAGKQVTFNGALGNTKAIVQMNLLGKSSVASINVNSTIDEIKFHHKQSGIKIADNITITGNLVANAANDGNVVFLGSGTITGTIGNGNALKSVLFKGAGAAITLGGDATATNFKYYANSNVTAAGNITGNVDFANNAGTLNVAGLITGNVDSTVGVNGTLNLTANGSGVNGTIGALNVVNASGGNIHLGGTIDTATLNVKNGATVLAAHNSAAAINVINIGEAVGAGTLVIDANAGNYDLLNGTTIAFEHADSLLKLTNTQNTGNHTVNLRGNVAPGEGIDATGRLEINSYGTKTLNLAVNAAETIGTNNVVRLKEFIISGDQNTTIAPGIFAKTITISSTRDVTFGAAIDSGAASTIDFTANGNTIFGDDVAVSTMAFGDKARVATLAAGKTLTVDQITSGAGSRSELVLADNGSNLVLNGANKTVTLDLIKAAAAGATNNLGAGTYTVADIQLGDAGGTLELADDFNLTGGINVGAGNAGTVKFLGNGKITDALGENANAVGAVTVEGNSTLELGGNVNVASLKGTNAANQNLSFINAGDIEVTGTIGGNAGTGFTKISFSGHKVDFKTNNALNANNPLLHFTAVTEVVTDGYDLGNTTITNEIGVNTNKFVVNADQTITGDIGTLAANPFGAIHISDTSLADRNVTIDTGNFFAGITGAKAKAIFNNANSSVSFLGAVGAKIKNANFQENGIVYGAVHAETIDVRAGKTAIFDHAIFDTDMTMHAADARADFAAKIALNTPILANAAGDGVINFNAGVDLNSNVGADGARVAAVTIGDNSSINADLHAQTITVGKHELTLAKNATFNGATGFTNTTLKLTDYDLTMKGGDVTFNGASTIETTVTGDKLGNLVAGAGTKISLAGGANIKVEITETNLAPTGTTIILIKKDGGTLDLDPNRIEVTKAGIFSEWTDSITDAGLVLTQKLKVEEKTNEIAKKIGNDDVVTTAFASAFANAIPGTQGFKVLEQVSLITDEIKLNEAEARIANTTSNEVSAVNLEIINEVTAVVSGRITSFAPTFKPAANMTNPTAITSQAIEVSSSENNYISGMSAGDDIDRFGVWATPFYSKSKQKKRTGTSGFKGFKAESYGGTFGFDTKANDDMILGIAFSAMNTDIKHTNFKSGDKTKISSYLVSVYGQHQFTNNWFGQGVFSMGSSNVNNKEHRRVSDTKLAIAEGKYSSMSFAAEILGGYNHLVNNQFVVTPMFGLNYNRINDGSYNEFGAEAGPQLMEVTKRASQKLDIVGGIKLTAMPSIINGITLTPEAHAFIRHDVIGKGAKVNAKIPGMDLPSEKAKLQKTFYNVGASLNAAYGAMDYGIFADANFADKYVGVQGALKLRVNF
jgi:outer membrane autotransporter protein